MTSHTNRNTGIFHTILEIRMRNIYVSFFTLFVLFALDLTNYVIANEKCREDQEFKRVFGPIERKCIQILDSCASRRMRLFDEDRWRARDACYVPYKTDTSFVGPCPSILSDLESQGLNTEETVLAVALLRGTLERRNEDGYISFYLPGESEEMVRGILKTNPDNLVAIHYLTTTLNDNNLVEKIILLNRLVELDPLCREQWFYRSRIITHYVQTLFNEDLLDQLNVDIISGRLRRDLVITAWDSLNSIYEKGYEMSEGPQKLVYALMMLHHPLLEESMGLDRIVDILDIDLRKRSAELRKRLSDDLIDDYYDPVSTDYSKMNAVNVFCNDYAFELGLYEQCVDFLAAIAASSMQIDHELVGDFTFATINSLLAATRNCGERFRAISDDHDSPLIELEVCVTENQNVNFGRLSNIIAKVKDRIPDSDYHLLLSYLAMNSNSASYLDKALKDNREYTKHAIWLAKRLYVRNLSKEALDVVGVGMKYEKPKEFESDKSGSDIVFELLNKMHYKMRGGQELGGEFQETARIKGG